MLKLVEGKYYQRRDGIIVGPVEKLIAGVTLGYNLFADGWTYNEHGRFAYSPHELDLVKEVPKPKLESIVESVNGAGIAVQESAWYPC